MKVTMCQVGLRSLVTPLALLALSGCTKQGPKAERPEVKPTQVAEQKKLDNHSAWWCAEHGVPEEVCGQCNAKVAAEYKKKGDWCKEHDRPDSQCFLCHPELKERFAAQYRAKYGKEPPPTEDEDKDKKETTKKG